MIEEKQAPASGDPLPLVSVVIAAYNAAATLSACLAALARQTWPSARLEVIVIDDGSTDGTAECARAAEGGMVSVLVRGDRGGPAAARNDGISTAAGEFVLFTDADCIPEPDWVEEITAPLRRDPRIAGVKGAYRTDQHTLAARFAQAEFEDRYRRLERRETIDFVDTSAAAFRREVLLDVGNFDTGYPSANNEDVDLSFRMAEAGHRLVFNRRAVVTHKHRETLAGYSKLKMSRGFWRMKVYRRHPGKSAGDSYTPFSLRLQLILLLAVAGCLAGMFLMPVLRGAGWIPEASGRGLSSLLLSAVVAAVVAFMISTLPFALRLGRQHGTLALLSPLFLVLRSAALLTGMTAGLVRFRPFLARRGKSDIGFVLLFLAAASSYAAPPLPTSPPSPANSVRAGSSNVIPAEETPAGESWWRETDDPWRSVAGHVLWQWEARNDPGLTEFVELHHLERHAEIEGDDPPPPAHRLQFLMTGPDPYLVSRPGLGIDAAEAGVVQIRLAATGELERDETLGQIFWRSGSDRVWRERQSIHFRVPLDGSLRTILVEVGRSHRWHGMIDQLRIDPVMEKGRLILDSVHVLQADAPDFRRENFMHHKPVQMDGLMELDASRRSARFPTPGMPLCRAVEVSSALYDTHGIEFGQTFGHLVLEMDDGKEVRLPLVNGLDSADIMLPGLWRPVPGIRYLGRSFFTRRRLPGAPSPRAVRFELLDLPENDGRLRFHVDQITFQTGQHLETKARFSGVQLERDPFAGPYAAEWIFSRDRGWQDWEPAGAPPLRILTEGCAELDLSGPADGLMTGSKQNIHASDADLVEVLLRVNSGVGKGRLWWITRSSSRYERVKSVGFSLNPYGGDEIYYLDVGRHPNWNDVITGLKLTPANHAARAGIGRIRLVKAPVLRLLRAEPMGLGWDRWLYLGLAILLLLSLSGRLLGARNGFKRAEALRVTPYFLLVIAATVAAVLFPFQLFSDWRLSVGLVKITPFHVCLLLILLFRFLAGTRFRNQDTRAGVTRCAWPAIPVFAIFLLVALTGSLLSRFPRASLQMFVAVYLPAGLVLLFARDAAAWKRGLPLWRSVVIAATAVGMLAVVEFVLGYNPVLNNLLKVYATFYYQAPIVRAASTFLVPLALSSYLVLVIPLAMYLAWRPALPHVNRAAWLACLAVLVAALMLTFSRSGLLILLAYIVVFLWRRRKRYLLAALPVLLLAPIVLYVSSETARNAMRDRFVDLGNVPRTAAVVQRAAGWRTGLEMVTHRPLLGVGPGNYFHEAKLYGRVKREEFQHEQYNTPDNMLVRIAAETGLLGLAAFGVFFWLMMGKLRRRIRNSASGEDRRMALALCYGLSGFAVSNLIFDGLYWLSLAVSGAVAAGLALGGRVGGTDEEQC